MANLGLNYLNSLSVYVPEALALVVMVGLVFLEATYDHNEKRKMTTTGSSNHAHSIGSWRLRECRLLIHESSQAMNFLLDYACSLGCRAQIQFSQRSMSFLHFNFACRVRPR